MTDHIFISHSSKDDPFVAELRQALELRSLTVWVDSRRLRAGDQLTPEIEQAISEAFAVTVVVSQNSLNSEWVHDEVAYARRIQSKRGADEFPIIPLLLPGMTEAVLRSFFPRKAVPVAIKIGEGPGALEAAMTDLLAALGERLPTDPKRHEDVAARPVAELLLRMTDPRTVEEEGTRRAAAQARLVYRPAEEGERDVESDPFLFKAPLGPIEAEELRWYLEKYPLWPVGQVYEERAAQVEESLPLWGKSLYQAVTEARGITEALGAWNNTPKSADRRFSIFVDPRLLEGTPKEKQDEADEAATLLLGLPWELLHDDRGYLFRGGRPVLVRRRLPNRRSFERVVAEPPIRVLLVSPRPEDEGVDYIDHRVIALPMTEAIAELGDLTQLSILSPPTFPALRIALEEAERRDKPFHVVHFDGHGVFDKRKGLGGLVFEDPQDLGKVSERRHEIIDAAEMATLMRERRVPLVSLNACQSAQAEEDPTASVAAALLDEGVASVVAMSHSVLVETARRFVTQFYQSLAAGARVGEAMLSSQAILYDKTFRLKVFGGNDLHLQDWFVPVLFQEEEDLQLFRQVPSEQIAREIQRERRLRLGDLPHKEGLQFVGRSRELLALERMLADQPWAIVVGQGGEGKTTLAVELAGWLVQTGRYDRAAWLSLEKVHDVRAAVDALGRQLVSKKYSVAEYPKEQLFKKALHPIQRALEDERTVIVVDNVESLLPPPQPSPKEGGSLASPPAGGRDFQELSRLFTTLLDADTHTRLIFTSREALPEPFAPIKERYWRLGRLSREDAVKLVESHMPAPPPPDDATRIEELVEAVQSHARSLVLLAPIISQEGVTVTAATLSPLMAQLHDRYGDDRERSLYASVELSLGRLAPEMRQLIRPLGVFQGGVHLGVLATMFADEGVRTMLGLDNTEVWTQDEVIGLVGQMAQTLAETNLAEPMEHNHLRLHPALCPYLARELSAEETQELTTCWAVGMVELTHYLYDQMFKDTQLAFTLTRLELPNLMVTLGYLAEHADPETALAVAAKVEQLLAELDRPRLLRRVVALRERVNQEVGGGLTDARFTAKRMEIERLLGAGQIQQAYEAAQGLLAECQAPGSEVSAHRQAITFFLLGRVLLTGGAAGEALSHLQEAQRLIAALGEPGARMWPLSPWPSRGTALETWGGWRRRRRLTMRVSGEPRSWKMPSKSPSARGNWPRCACIKGGMPRPSQVINQPDKSLPIWANHSPWPPPGTRSAGHTRKRGTIRRPRRPTGRRWPCG
jgi:hypothetical protein